MCHLRIAGADTRVVPGIEAEGSGATPPLTTDEIDCGDGAGEENDVRHCLL